MDIQNLDLMLQVQTTLQRKSLDQQASNILGLIRSVAPAETPAGGRNDNLGQVVDSRA